MMRKLLCGAAAAVCLGAAGPAMANGSLKDVEPVMPAPTWTGFYLGAGIGAGAVVHDLDVDAFVDELDKGKCETSGSGYTCSNDGRFNLFDASLGFDGIGGEGVIGTFQIGYDWQNWSRWVVGVFADFDVSGIETDLDFSANAFDGFAVSGDGEVDMDYMWTIGARIGYLTTPDTMLYLLLGYS